MNLGWRPSKQAIVGWALALVTVLAVLANQRDVGIARDETVYFSSGTRYAQWWLGLVTFEHGVSKKSIDDVWGGAPGGGNNSEHPPLFKTAMGLSHWLLFDKLHVTDELTAFRFPGAVLAGLLVLLVYSMTLALWGFPEAIVAALCTLLLPRALFHAGLACFDAPIMTLWFATIYAYWRCLDERKWPWQVGVVFGLALATKHNAILLPFALGLHYIVIAWRAGKWRGLLYHKPRVMLSLAVLGPLTLLLLWPWLWLDPIGHVKQWLSFHMTHVHYNFEYLGDNWNAPRFPWHVALVTTLFTVPVATLAAACAGASVFVVRWRRGETADHERSPALLLGLSAAASIGPFFLGTTPIFGAEKHWMPALPTICIAAGVGAGWAARQAADYVRTLRPVSETVARRIALGIVGGTIVLACGTETVAAQPYALTWYNALAGGASGGADLGMNRQFWGVSARGVLPFLGYQFPAKTYWHDASPAAGWYQRLGVLRGFPHSGQEQAGIEASNLAMVIHEKHFNRHDYLIWKSYGTVKPVFVLRSEGVPIVSVYKRPVPR
jgi:4-amino-4-deoxy-L-arabinose transferase-like glycosyltransferase